MEEISVLAGECTTEFEGRRDLTQRGRAVCLRKPDGTVLVHDADGYQPTAWLTRADAVTVAGDPPTVEARDGDQRLTVRFHAVDGRASYPAGAAGTPVGDCPDCGGRLVRSRRRVTCTGVDCDADYGLPSGATALDATCDCGLPRIRAERGAAVEVCLDRDCESLDDAVRAAFDRAWDCPDCGSDLRVLRRGGLIAGCDAYPDCEAAFAIPEGVVAGACDCGLPAFAVGDDRRCLDATCGRTDGMSD